MMKKKEENTLAKNQKKINELAALFPEETVQEEGDWDWDLFTWAAQKNAGFIQNNIYLTLDGWRRIYLFSLLKC